MNTRSSQINNSHSAVYLPFLTRCKMRVLWTDAPANYLFLLQQVSNMPKKVQKTVKENIQLGAYCCYSETVLQATLSGQDEEERRFAIKQIKKVVVMSNVTMSDNHKTTNM